MEMQENGLKQSITSQLLDRSIVKIKHSNHHRYNFEPIFENHYTYPNINK